MSGRRALGYDTRFGSGWISGVAAVVLGALGLGAVLCLLFPDVLTSPETRGYYPLPAVRFLVHVVLVGAFGLGLLSVVLSRRLRLGLTGMGLGLAAVLLGFEQHLARLGTAGGRARLQAEHRAQCVTLGREVRVETTAGVIAGRATTIDDDGRLVVDAADGPVAVGVGDVVHVR